MPKGVAPAHGNPSWSAIAFDLHLLSGGGRLTPAVYFKRLRYLLPGNERVKQFHPALRGLLSDPGGAFRCYNNLSYPCLGSLGLEELLGGSPSLQTQLAVRRPAPSDSPTVQEGGVLAGLPTLLSRHLPRNRRTIHYGPSFFKKPSFSHVLKCPCLFSFESCLEAPLALRKRGSRVAMKWHVFVRPCELARKEGRIVFVAIMQCQASLVP